MNPLTRERLLFTAKMLNRWDVSLALFVLQICSAVTMTLSSWGWFATPFYVLSGFDGYRLIRRIRK